MKLIHDKLFNNGAYYTIQRRRPSNPEHCNGWHDVHETNLTHALHRHSPHLTYEQACVPVVDCKARFGEVGLLTKDLADIAMMEMMDATLADKENDPTDHVLHRIVKVEVNVSVVRTQEG